MPDAASSLLTSAARQTTVSQDIAATGSIRSTASYARSLGARPAVVTDGSTSAASSGGTWQVLDTMTSQRTGRAWKDDLDARGVSSIDAHAVESDSGGGALAR